MRSYANTLVLILSFLLLACTGCSRQEKSPEQIQQETASATAKLKRDTVAMAKGIKQGLSNQQMVNINSAPESELTSLPGINTTIAQRIIARRPFDNKDQLVTRRILTEDQFSAISNRITVGK